MQGIPSQKSIPPLTEQKRSLHRQCDAPPQHAETIFDLVQSGGRRKSRSPYTVPTNPSGEGWASAEGGRNVAGPTYGRGAAQDFINKREQIIAELKQAKEEAEVEYRRLHDKVRSTLAARNRGGFL